MERAGADTAIDGAEGEAATEDWFSLRKIRALGRPGGGFETSLPTPGAAPATPALPPADASAGVLVTCDRFEWLPASLKGVLNEVLISTLPPGTLRTFMMHAHSDMQCQSTDGGHEATGHKQAQGTR